MLAVIAVTFGVSVDDIVSQRRTRAILPARHAAAYLVAIRTGLNSEIIGKHFGNRDGALIELYCRCAARRAAHDKVFAELLQRLEELL